jgi:putative transposase
MSSKRYREEFKIEAVNVAESFFQLLKRERIKKKIYTTRSEARTDIFEYIEMFYNSKRRHGSNGQRSPLEYEKPISI